MKLNTATAQNYAFNRAAATYWLVRELRPLMEKGVPLDRALYEVLGSATVHPIRDHFRDAEGFLHNGMDMVREPAGPESEWVNVLAVSVTTPFRDREYFGDIQEFLAELTADPLPDETPEELAVSPDGDVVIVWNGRSEDEVDTDELAAPEGHYWLLTKPSIAGYMLQLMARVDGGPWGEVVDAEPIDLYKKGATAQGLIWQAKKVITERRVAAVERRRMLEELERLAGKEV